MHRKRGYGVSEYRQSVTLAVKEETGQELQGDERINGPFFFFAFLSSFLSFLRLERLLKNWKKIFVDPSPIPQTS